MIDRTSSLLAPLAAILLAATPAHARQTMDMPMPADSHAGHAMPPAAPVTAAPAPSGKPQMPLMDMPGAHPATPPGDDAAMPPEMTMAPGSNPAGMGNMADMAGMDHPMRAMLGPWSMRREASGTGWQPDSSPMMMTMFSAGAWQLMTQGYATFLYDDQGGPRGGSKTFSESMAMLMANRPIGANGTLGLRAMLSLDPLMGKRGYPLLFATGETANGVDHLVDRQHPHDLFMELAASYAHDLGGGRSLSLYAGLPGEPALGPPTFMHRVSGMPNPEAPIGHHWFDSTHITWGVVTAGYATRHWKIEASAFKGREPDQHRYDIESPKLDSWAVRAFWNPTANLSLQLSTGHLHSPEQLEPDVDERRTTASATWNLPLGDGANWATTIAWSDKDLRPGPALTGLLAETALRLARRHTIYARAEREEENELFEAPDPLAGRIVTVDKFSLGYQYELPLSPDVRIAFGGLASAYAYPRRLEPAYGDQGIKSFMLYTRVSFGRMMP